MEKEFEQIKKLLEKNKIKYVHIKHEHVTTSKQAAEIRGTKLSQAAKALILEQREKEPKNKNKQENKQEKENQKEKEDNNNKEQEIKSDQIYMFVVGANKKIDLKKIKKEILNIKNISLASPKKVFEKTNCTIGSVPPFGNIFGIKVFLDEDFKRTQEEIVFSAGTHNDSIKMKMKDFLKIVKPKIKNYSKEFD